MRGVAFEGVFYFEVDAIFDSGLIMSCSECP